MDIFQDFKNQAGFYYDQMIILIPKIFLASVLCGIIFIIIRTIRKRLTRFLMTKAEDQLIVNFIDSVIKIFNTLLLLLLFLYIIGLGGISNSILGAATVSSIVIGFAFKDIAENFLAGVILAFRRPFRLGDTVKTGDVEGSITEMSLRDTHIKTFDGKDVYVPNGQIIKSPLYNYTIDGFLRKKFEVGIDYNSDINEARKIILDTVKSIPGVLQGNKGPKTLIQNLGDSSIIIAAQYWVNTFNTEYVGSEIHSRAITSVLDNLNNAGIIMPGNIIELKNIK